MLSSFKRKPFDEKNKIPGVSDLGKGTE